MTLKEKILAEFKRKNYKKDFHWVFQQYNSFRCDLPSFEKEEFTSALEELCEEGLLMCVTTFSPPHYCLTLEGEKYLYDR